MLLIKKIRKESNLSQKEAADALKMSQSNYSRIENGQQSINMEQLKILSLLFKCSADDLLGITEEVKEFRRIQEKISNDLLGNNKNE